jgi:SulP family sulfate permease
MEGIVGGEPRNLEIAEVYHLSHAHQPIGGSLISEADWARDNGSFEDEKDGDVENNDRVANETTGLLGGRRKSTSSSGDGTSFLAEIPAIIVTLMINFMAAIPFGVSYFPLGWSNDHNGTNDETDSENGGIEGPFPLPGKEALGIRMFLVATITGQVVLAFASNFTSPVSTQLVENIPFYHALASIVIAEQGYGPEALSTLFFLFGLSSFVTGLLFFGLGSAGLGRAVHYFPSHVLVGFIGGIGVFIAFSSVGVLTGEELEFTPEGFDRLVENFGQLAPSLAFEVVLRILTVVLTDENGEPKFGLLAPVFFLSIVPMFYIGLYFCGISTDEATDRGYFFAAVSNVEANETNGSDAISTDQSSFLAGIFDNHLLDVFRVVDIGTVSWRAVLHSLVTIVGLSCFSVINVPINIPAFANTCKVDVDMNNELIAHGYSNMLTGILGGTHNVMTYSVSVLFYKSGGRSRAAQIALIIGTIIIFLFGVAVMPYLPKCLAGTLLLHIGVDLFIEGLYDSIEEYDNIEYGGVSRTELVTAPRLDYF